MKHFRHRKILYFAPHPDDLALSSGGFVIRQHLQVQIHVVTCFSQSLWAPNLTATDVSTISQIRRQEDLSYCRRYGIASNTYLDLPDSEARGYYGYVGRLQDEQPLLRRLQQRITSLSIDGQATAVFLPLAIGNHIDHVMTRNAVRDCFDHCQLYYYEDLPYAAELDDDQIRTHITDVLSRPEKIVVHLTSGDIRTKSEDFRLYASQFDKGHSNAVARHAARSQSAELVWTNAFSP